MRWAALLAAWVIGLVTALAVAGSGSAGSVQARWVMRDLGTLGGRYSKATAINERGQVVGISQVKPGGGYGYFLWQNGRLTDLAPIPHSLRGDLNFSGDPAINATGQVLLPIWGRPMMWEKGRRRDLGTLGGRSGGDLCGEECTYAYAINDRGQIVGQSLTKTGELHAFVWQRGKMTDLGTLGGKESCATGINERGQIVGDSDTKARDTDGNPISHAFLWENGKMTDLGTPGWFVRHGQCDEVAINNHGQISGVAINDRGQSLWNGVRHAFLHENGKDRDLGVLPGFRWSEAVAINNTRQIVGTSSKPPLKSHAFVWQDGVMTDLGRTGKGPTDSYAFAINDKGQIVGWSETGEGSGWGSSDPPHHAVLWTLRSG